MAKALTRDERRARIRALQQSRLERELTATHLIHTTRFDPLRPLRIDNRTDAGEVHDLDEICQVERVRDRLRYNLLGERRMLLLRGSSAIVFAILALSGFSAFWGTGLFWTGWALLTHRRVRKLRRQVAALDAPVARLLP